MVNAAADSKIRFVKPNQECTLIASCLFQPPEQCDYQIAAPVSATCHTPSIQSNVPRFSKSIFHLALLATDNQLQKEAILSRAALAAASDLIEPLQSMHVITDLADVMAMRGQALSRAGEELSYAQSVVDERDKQLAAVVQQKEYAESIVQKRDRQLHKVTEHPILRHLLKLLVPDLHNGKD